MGSIVVNNVDFLKSNKLKKILKKNDFGYSTTKSKGEKINFQNLTIGNSNEEVEKLGEIIKSKLGIDIETAYKKEPKSKKKKAVKSMKEEILYNAGIALYEDNR
jgi:uncharacterized protein YktB (UPF0637 family)